MHREIEAKILNVDPEEAQKKLREIGATFEKELDLEQIIWWVPNEKRSSVRVRRSSDGVIRLTMKRDVPQGLGYHEWECDISDYEIAVTIIDTLVPHPNLRIEYTHHCQDWRLEGALINIDWFPKLEPLIEIEAENEEKVNAIAAKLGFDTSMLVNKGVVTLLYERLGLKQGDTVKVS